jgi:hypothetical protein
VTVWDTEVDAAEFYDAMSDLVSHRYEGVNPTAPPVGKKAPDAGSSKQWTAGARTVFLRGTTVAGRPAVMYLDAPTGVPATLIDLAKVTLRE